MLISVVIYILQVEQFQITNAIATAKCSEVMAGRIKLYTIPGNEWSSPIHLTINLCTDFSMDNIFLVFFNFINFLENQGVLCNRPYKA